jgi:hypothetical protein
MTLDGLDTGEHWLSLPVNVLAGDTSFTDRSGVS